MVQQPLPTTDLVLAAVPMVSRAMYLISDVSDGTGRILIKILQQHWGRQKVLYQLRLKHLSKEAIAASMKMVDDDTYYGILREEADKKLRTLGDEQGADYYRRLYSFLTSRGYTMSEINHVITNIPEQ